MARPEERGGDATAPADVPADASINPSGDTPGSPADGMPVWTLGSPAVGAAGGMPGSPIGDAASGMSNGPAVGAANGIPGSSADGASQGTPGGPADGTPGGAADDAPADLASMDTATLLGGDIPFRPMSISEMLDGAVAGIRRAPRTTLGLSLAVTTVIQVAGSVTAYFFVGDQARDEVTPSVLLRSLGAQFTLGMISLVLSAYGVLLLAGLLGPVLGRGLFGLPNPPRQAWRDARPKVGALLVVSLAIMGAALLGLLVPAGPFLALLAVDAHPALSALAAIVGVPAGIALMVWLYVLLVLAAPAVVLERQPVGRALARARHLSRGRWWRTCGTLLLALLVTVFMGFFALRIPFLLAQLIFFGDAEGGGAALGALALDTVGRIVSWSVVLPFDAGVIALLYMDRRMRREGMDLDLRTRSRAGADGFFELWRPAERPAQPPTQPPFQPPAQPPNQWPAARPEAGRR
ncbi:hypothetical protein [Actinomadura hibisca]|uniref:hypothetical protein n=1 Tax=Actinomadura hibisca TaxID=68565 RepID=UPI0008313318|nr:hypothetical protein [Actinomadura hibisca]